MSILHRFRARPTAPGPYPGAAASRTGSVSVVMPLFNHARFVAEAVRSVRAQGDAVGEIILVDDGSTDDTAAQASAAAHGSSARVIAWSQPNAGAHSALNAGLARATGDYVAILNSDDRWSAGRLDTLLTLLENEPSVGLVASALRSVDADGAPVPNTWYDEAKRFADDCGDLGTALLNGNVLVSTSNYVFRRSVLGRTGGFAPLRYAHDLDWALRLLTLGFNIRRVDDVLLDYRVHATNTISEDHDAVRVEWALAAAAYLAHVLDAEDARAWQRAASLLDTLERHRIARAAVLAAAHLRRGNSRTLERSPIREDATFIDVLRRAL